MLIAARASAIVWAYYQGKLPQGLSERNALAGAGKRFLVNKYYLDYLYEKVIVAGIKGPIAAGVYWFNQNVIDNVLNYTGQGRAGARSRSRTTTSTKRVSTVWSTASPRSPATPAARSARSRPVACSSTHSCSSSPSCVFAGALWIFT